jgi:hypothetical protein
MTTFTDELRERAAGLMGWTFEESTALSLPTLASLVRGKDPELDVALAKHIRLGLHWFEKPPRQRGRIDYR